MLDVVAENAARLCDADNAVIHRVDGDDFQNVAKNRLMEMVPEPQGRHPISRGSVAGRAIIDRQTIHVDDLLARIDTEYPNVRLMQGGYLALEPSLPRLCYERKSRLGLS